MMVWRSFSSASASSIFASKWVKSRTRFVQQYDFGIEGKRASEAKPLLLPSGQL